MAKRIKELKRCLPKEGRNNLEKYPFNINDVISACAQHGVILSPKVFHQEKFRILRENQLPNIFEKVGCFNQEYLDFFISKFLELYKIPEGFVEVNMPNLLSAVLPQAVEYKSAYLRTPNFEFINQCLEKFKMLDPPLVVTRYKSGASKPSVFCNQNAVMQKIFEELKAE